VAGGSLCFQQILTIIRFYDEMISLLMKHFNVQSLAFKVNMNSNLTIFTVLIHVNKKKICL